MMRPAAAARGRRYDLDWLRIGATFLLFPFHVAKTFDTLPIYHVKNAVLSPGLDYATVFVHQWHMPLFFVLSGWAAHGSIVRRGAGNFVRQRVRRLAVPFVTGVVLLCPVIKYLELRSGLSITATGAHRLAAPFDETFLAFLPSFFTRADRFTWSHLWFLLYLFAFSLLYAPLFARRAGRAPAAVSPARLYAPLVPLVLIQTTLRFRWPGVQNLYDDWANVAYYSLFFVLGFELARVPAWEAIVAREWRRAAAVGACAAAAMSLVWWLRGGVASPRLDAPWLAATLLVQALSAVTGYCVVVALLGGARRWLTVDSPARAYLAEASFPIYVLHQVAIVGLGFLVVQMDVRIAIKGVALLAGSLAATLAAYHWLVRPSAVVRAALGSVSAGDHGPTRAAQTSWVTPVAPG